MRCANFIIICVPCLALKLQHEQDTTQTRRTKLVFKNLEWPESENLLSRPLAYKHISKTGGSFLKALLRSIVPEFALLEEDVHVNDTHRALNFVIASVRNPCEWQASFYGYNLRLKQYECLRNKNIDVKQVRGYECPYCLRDEEVSAEDRAAFFQYLKDECPEVEDNADSFKAHVLKNLGYESGLLSRAFADDPGTFGLLAEQNECRSMQPEKYADCWVSSERIKDDTRQCLLMYEQIGGRVDWDLFETNFQMSAHNDSPHKGCTELFTPELSQQVKSADLCVFEAFGYPTCCGASQEFVSGQPRTVNAP